MMQLLCNGTFLDLYEGSGLQFTHKNPLFAFDALECERTTSFKIPTTPKNDRVLALSKLPALSGVAMRRKYDAELHDGAVVKRGYIYVSNFDGKDYNAIFVTGELIGLQEIRDAGKIADFWHPAGSIVWSNANVKDANTYAGQQSLALTRYKTNDMPCHPSFDLSDVMNYAYQAITGHGLTVPRQRGFRLIPKELPTLPKMSVTITYAGTGVDYDESYQPTQYANVMTISDGAQIIQQQDLVLLIGVGGSTMQWKYLKLHQFVPRQSIIITFPSDFPSGYYLMSIEDKGTDGSNPEYNYLSQDWFLGGYSFRQKSGGGTVSSGTPLAGRSVEIPSGTPFMILPDAWYDYQPSPFNWNGFRFINDSNYELSGIVIEGKDIAVGDTVRAMDILPDLTLVELFKIYAYCVGKVLMYDETNGVSFDDLDFSSWQVVNISDKLTKRGEVSRRFGDYVQHNYIRFKSGGDVPVNQTITQEYTVDNDNLESAQDIGTIPYSEGSIDVDGGYTVARFDAEDTTKHKLYADGIMFCGAAACGLRISLPKNAGLQALCDASTQIQVGARLTLLEYERITPKTLIYVDGTEYVWTSRNWQKNEAQFTLARLYEVGAEPTPPSPFEGYTRVEWIKPVGDYTYGGAHINTGVQNSATIGCELVVTMVSDVEGLYGSLENGKRNGFGSYANVFYMYSSGGGAFSSGFPYNTKFILQFNYPNNGDFNRLDANGTLVTHNTTSIANGGSFDMFIFGCSAERSGHIEAYTIQNYFLKLHEARIFDGQTLLRNMYPCRRNDDNALGLLDIVNNVFYTNAGGSSFEAGPDVN